MEDKTMPKGYTLRDWGPFEYIPDEDDAGRTIFNARLETFRRELAAYPNGQIVYVGIKKDGWRGDIEYLGTLEAVKEEFFKPADSFKYRPASSPTRARYGQAS